MNLSGPLARKLQRSASLVNAGLSETNSIVVDRCDFVETCCSDAPCLTEAVRQRGISSFSLLPSDGFGNHDAQTREKLLRWFSEKRPRKAWFSPPVIAHQNNSTRCSSGQYRNSPSLFQLLSQSEERNRGHISDTMVLHPRETSVTSSRIRNVVVPITVVERQTRTFSQTPSLHLLIKVPIFVR